MFVLQAQVEVQGEAQVSYSDSLKWFLGYSEPDPQGALLDLMLPNPTVLALTVLKHHSPAIPSLPRVVTLNAAISCWRMWKFKRLLFV